ncbi:MAG: serine hydrolase [Moraxellaceae bacterium]|jgi:CubicO group peptidase (beta-lactamase class C family)|nr:serine hydrolase [Moraxellaceae bacterium]
MPDGRVHPDFRRVAEIFLEQLPVSRPGGGALCIYYRGECVVDIWGGTRDRQGTPWTPDTLSLSFSTTKGIVATLLHILASRGQVDYDAPVARYWPAFAQGGKGGITVRQLLCHEAGLYSIRRLIQDAGEMRDWPHMLALIEKTSPLHEPGIGNGYHALTFGWLVGGLIEKVTGNPLAQVLKEELVEPLQLDGCFIGVPDAALPRCADLIVPERKPRDPARPRRPRKPPLAQQVVVTALKLSGFDPDSVEEAMVPPGMGRFDWNTKETRQACIPGAGGMFNARSLARIYAMLADGGELDGKRLLAPGAVDRFAQIQNTSRGAVIPLPMHWRMGYHRVFTMGPRTPRAFGHFGYGGSGAWCDPSRQLALGYVVNSGVGTPFGDTRLWKINTAAIRAVDSLPSLIWQWLRA